MSGEVFQWKCREVGCGAVHLAYKEHIDHLVAVHGLLTGQVHATAVDFYAIVDIKVLRIGDRMRMNLEFARGLVRENDQTVLVEVVDIRDGHSGEKVLYMKALPSDAPPEMS